LGERRIRLGAKVQSNSRIQFDSNQAKLVPRKLDPEPLLSKVGLRAIEISINWRLVCTLFQPDFKF
jgi:hypothetical protein